MASDSETVTELDHEHTYDVPSWTWATDYSNAIATFTCTSGDDTQNVTDNAPVQTLVSEPTCKTDKIVKYTATVTFKGIEYKTESDNITIQYTALGHQWSDWVETKAPTETEDGYKMCTCSRCKATRTLTIPKIKIPNIWDIGFTISPVINPEEIETSASMSNQTMTIRLGTFNADNCLVEYRKAGAKTWQSVWYGHGSQVVIKNMKKNGLYQYRFTAFKKVNEQWRKYKPSNTCYRWIRNIRAKKPVTGKKTITVKWTKVKEASGYEVQGEYSVLNIHERILFPFYLI